MSFEGRTSEDEVTKPISKRNLLIGVTLVLCLFGLQSLKVDAFSDLTDSIKSAQSDFDSTNHVSESGVAIGGSINHSTSDIIPLTQLVNTSPSTKDDCGEKQSWMGVKKKPLDPNQLIPNIIHQTSKTRCMPQIFVYVINLWKTRLPEYSHYLHDDDAVWRLLNKDWSQEFPHLKYGLQCINSMTAVADVWRYLVLWEYGGIYSDLDTGPNSFNASTILPDDDALFVVENFDAPSQYWMAVSPKHPLMYYAVHHALLKVMMLPEIGTLDASLTTGPFALLDGLTWFMYDVGNKHVKKPIVAGTYHGRYNRTVRIIGEGRGKSDEIIKREFLGWNQKRDTYNDEMGMHHFAQMKRRWRAYNRTCLSVFYDLGVGAPDGFVAPRMGLDPRPK